MRSLWTASTATTVLPTFARDDGRLLDAFEFELGGGDGGLGIGGGGGGGGGGGATGASWDSTTAVGRTTARNDEYSYRSTPVSPVRPTPSAPPTDFVDVGDSPARRYLAAHESSDDDDPVTYPSAGVGYMGGSTSIATGAPSASDLDLLHREMVDIKNEVARLSSNPATERLVEALQEALVALRDREQPTPSNGQSTGLLDLQESMEMRTSKIAKMVHELLQLQREKPDAIEDVKSAVDEVGRKVVDMVQSRQPEATPDADLSTSIEEVKTSLARLESLCEKTLQESAVHTGDAGQLMTMMAQANQMGAGVRGEALELLKSIRETLRRQVGSLEEVHGATKAAATAKDIKAIERVLEQTATADELSAVKALLQTASHEKSGTLASLGSLETATKESHSLMKESKASIASIASTVEEVKTRLSLPTNGPTRTGSGDRLDRPTTNMITSINDKLIHVSRLVDHVQATQTVRFAGIEERLANPSGLGQRVTEGAKEGDESATDQMLQQHKLTDIRESLEGIAERVARLGREGQARHDVVDGRLERLGDQVKHMHRAVGKLVQVGMMGEGDDAASMGSGGRGAAGSIVEYRALLERMSGDIDDIKEAVAGDSITGGERLQALLGMFAISQDTHAQVSETVKTVAEGVKDLVSRAPIATDDAWGPLEQRIEALLSKSPKLATSASDSTVHRLVESIHSCLVSYLPIDLESRLNALQSAVSALSRATSQMRTPLSISDSGPPSVASPEALRELLDYHQDLASREHARSAALDSIQHALARILESQTAPPQPTVTDVTEISQLRDAVMDMHRVTVGRPEEDERKRARVEHEMCRLEERRVVLQKEVRDLEGRRDWLLGKREPLYAFDLRGASSRRISCPPGIHLAPASE
ncbi:hypothetical protein HKX48_000448 [Thoreauomyces humboldtii]|nr:hypothetical protein HKX48_000448 [Thoreauomyces humboldtii]